MNALKLSQITDLEESSHCPRIQDMPNGERPREKLAHLGPSALDNAELMALFISTGIRGRSAIEIGRTLISKYGSIGALGSLPVSELAKERGMYSSYKGSLWDKGILPLDSLDLLTAACAEHGIAHILPAHGYVLGFAEQAIAQLKAHRLKREAKVISAMRALPHGTLEEWVAHAYDDVPERLWPVAARSLQAHVDRIQSMPPGNN